MNIPEKTEKSPSPSKKSVRIVLLTLLIFLVGLISYLGYQYIQTRAKLESLTPDPILALPFSPEDKPEKLAPMGETLYHPDEFGGHKGIDFRWYDNKSPKITAAMDAGITAIIESKITAGVYNVITSSGSWGVVYTDIEEVNPDLHVGSALKIGDYVGTPTRLNFPGDVTFLTMHLQFGYTGNLGERVQDSLCPLTYFRDESRKRIQEIWTDTNWPLLKSNSREICSGYYKDRAK